MGQHDEERASERLFEKVTKPLGLRRIIFTEKQIDGTAVLVSAEAMNGLPDAFVSFLTDSQLRSLQEEIRELTKTNLLFSLMNHLEDE
jgi:hypothetical protein